MQVKINKVKRPKFISMQDDVIELLLRRYPHFVLHGGIVITHCLNGNRNPKDIDILTNMDPQKLNLLRGEVYSILEGAGYTIKGERYSKMNKLLIDKKYTLPKISATKPIIEKTITLHINFSKNGIFGKIDLTFMTKKVKCVKMKYIRSDGLGFLVCTLPLEALLKEKIDKYIYQCKRNSNKMQDLYDITILVKKFRKLPPYLRKSVSSFIKEIKDMPPKNEYKIRKYLSHGAPINFKEAIRIIEKSLH